MLPAGLSLRYARAALGERLPILPDQLIATIGRIGEREVLVISHALAPIGGLTPALQAVAELAAGGLTNKRIAETRGTSPATVARQLADVYRRLGVGSRAELAVRMAPIEVTGAASEADE